MIHCPKCNFKTEPYDNNWNTLKECPFCHVNWLEFLEDMANDTLWPAMVARDKSDVICPKCGYERTEADSATLRTTCPECDVVYASLLSSARPTDVSSSTSLKKCPKCAEPIQKEAIYCKHCHSDLSIGNKISANARMLPASSPTVINNQEASIACPKCGSSQITSNTKGFSGVKAAAGVLFIPGGILWGLHGKNRIIITCLKCANQWEPKPR